ncbi:MAG: hypothetical protein JWM86_1235 [Thermoleophilia bacterium]|nr:hypothetical protein [Thermoleophilia bacterium]
MSRWRFPVLLVASAACTLAAASGAMVQHALAATPETRDQFVIVDEPDEGRDDDAAGPKPPLARLQAAQAQGIAMSDRDLRTAIGLRPGSSIRIRFLETQLRWRVSVRDGGSKKTLASVEVDDRTGAIVKRSVLPYGDYPSRHTKREAIDAAVADPRARRVAKRYGGIEELEAVARLDACCWEIDLYRDGTKRTGPGVDPVMRVDIVDATLEPTGVWTGIQIPWKMARGDRYAFGGDMNDRVTWLPLFALFALVALDWRRLRSMLTLDVAALLLLGVSHELFLQGRIGWSVPLAVPPLLWLAARMGWVALRGLPAQRAPLEPRTRVGRLVLRPVPTWMLVVFCVALAGIRIGVTIDGGNVIDVGYAGVAGARLELEGKAPWGNMPEDNPRGDTYGPANYLAYVPAVAALDDPDTDVWGTGLPAATATSIAADVLCALVLAAIGWRWISRRGGLLLAAGWLACPWTAWALASSVNDAVLALALLIAFACLRVPLLRGAFIGIATMVKFAPIVALAPMLHAGVRGRVRQSILTVVGAAAAIGAGLAWVVWRIDGSAAHALGVFRDRTVDFQLERGSPFSPWGYYDWETAQHVAQVVVLALIAALSLWPRRRDAWQVAAGVACSLILVQLVVTHWFYLYVPWFVGFVLLVLVAARERPYVAPATTAVPAEDDATSTLT